MLIKVERDWIAGKVIVKLPRLVRSNCQNAVVVGYYRCSVLLNDLIEDVIAESEAMAKAAQSCLVVHPPTDVPVPTPRASSGRGDCSATALNNAQDRKPSAGPPGAPAERVRKTAICAQGEQLAFTERGAA